MIEGYFCLIENFNDYMNLCLVYQEVQASLLNDSSGGNMVIIIQNAIILVQGLRFIENGKRFSQQDHKFEGERHKKLQTHKLGFTGFGIDDFIYEEARATPIFRWIKTTFRKNKMIKLLEHNVDRISDIINEKYNSLRNSIQGLTVERDKVVFGSTSLRTYMITPLYLVSTYNNADLVQ